MRFGKPTNGNDLMLNYTYNLIGVDQNSPLSLKTYDLLEEINLSEVLGNVNQIVENIQNFKKQYPEYENLRVETISYRTAHSVFEQATFLLGERWEDEMEVKRRLSKK